MAPARVVYWSTSPALLTCMGTPVSGSRPIAHHAATMYTAALAAISSSARFTEDSVSDSDFQSPAAIGYGFTIRLDCQFSATLGYPVVHAITAALGQTSDQHPLHAKGEV